MKSQSITEVNDDYLNNFSKLNFSTISSNSNSNSSDSNSTHIDFNDYVNILEHSFIFIINKPINDFNGINLDSIELSGFSLFVNKTFVLTLPNVNDDEEVLWLSRFNLIKPNRKLFNWLETLLTLSDKGNSPVKLQLVAFFEPSSSNSCNFIVNLKAYLSKDLDRVTQPIQQSLKLLLIRFNPPPPPKPFTPLNLSTQWFYSILRPSNHVESSQPSALKPQLKPFQKRSLKFLQYREENLHINEPGWVQFSDTHMYSTITGAISTLNQPKLSRINGSLLSEEMGLGKTVEMLGLISSCLEQSVNFSKSVSNAEKRPIKTTLIITPDHLLKQWVEEALKHTNLKIFKYNGYENFDKLLNEAQTVLPFRDSHSPKALKYEDSLSGDIKSIGKSNYEDDDFGNNFNSNSRKRKLSSGRKRNKTNKFSKLLAEHNLDIDNIFDADSFIFEIDNMDNNNTSVLLNRPLVRKIFNKFDIVISSYRILSKDLNVAQERKPRSRRSGVQYREYIPISPLVQSEFFRVCQDEIQLAGVTRAAEMTSLIPRHTSIASSGTPVTGNIDHLLPILQYLGFTIGDQLINKTSFSVLASNGLSNDFENILNKISVRTTKEQVQKELSIPPQTRYIVPLQMSAPEIAFIEDRFRTALNELNLNEQGEFITLNFDLDVIKLRGWITKLRQLTTNPQTGLIVKENAIKTFKTIEQVLERMIEDVDSQLLTEERQYYATIAKIARLHLLLKYSDSGKEKERLDRERSKNLLIFVRNGINNLITNVHQQIKLFREKKPKSLTENFVEIDDGTFIGIKDLPEINVTSKDDEESILRKEYQSNITGLISRHRDLLIVLHEAHLILGDIGHIENNKDDEDKGYDDADNDRSKILAHPIETVRKRSEVLTKYNDEKEFEKELLIDIVDPQKFGLKNIKKNYFIIDEMNLIIAKLNESLNFFMDIRQKALSGLLNPVEKSKDEANTETYNQDAELQANIEVYLETYEALINDRKQLIGITNISDYKNKPSVFKERKANANVQARQQLMLENSIELPKNETNNNQSLDTDQDILKRKLLEQRLTYKLRENSKTFHTAFIEFKNFIDKSNIVDDEKLFIKAYENLHDKYEKQVKTMNKISNQELNDFHHAFNSRIIYFKQLQVLSDSVGPLDIEIHCHENEKVLENVDVYNEILSHEKTENNLNDQSQKLKAKLNYLKHIQSSSEGEDKNDCIICLSTIRTGMITSCGHIFCSGCLYKWKSKSNVCPSCRSELNMSSCYKTKMPPRKSSSKMKDVNNDNNDNIGHNGQRIRPVYNTIDEIEFDKIENQKIFVSGFGIKIDTLCKHVLLLRSKKLKSVVFSSWIGGMNIIEKAFQSNGIAYTRSYGYQSNVDKFQKDPSIDVCLLNGEKESSGLNLTAASVVIFIDPVCNFALELQAIGRVDRMGQNNQVEVFNYVAKDTIDEAIIDLAALKGHSIYLKNPNKKQSLNYVDDMDSLQKASTKGDFISKTEDLLSLLLPDVHISSFQQP